MASSCRVCARIVRCLSSVHTLLASVRVASSCLVCARSCERICAAFVSCAHALKRVYVWLLLVLCARSVVRAAFFDRACSLVNENGLRKEMWEQEE